MAYRKICAMNKCPEKTHARLRDKIHDKRVDLCIVHAVLTKKHYKANVEVVEEWGENKVFDQNGEIVLEKIKLETKEEAEAKAAKDIVKEALADARS